MILSFLRVEDYLIPLFGQDLGMALGRPNFRGTYVHFPVMLISLIIASAISFEFPVSFKFCITS